MPAPGSIVLRSGAGRAGELGVSAERSPLLSANARTCRDADTPNNASGGAALLPAQRRRLAAAAVADSSPERIRARMRQVGFLGPRVRASARLREGAATGRTDRYRSRTR